MKLNILLICLSLFLLSCYRQPKPKFDQYLETSPNSMTKKEYERYFKPIHNSLYVNSVNDLYLLARNAYQKGDYQTSIHYYTKMLKMVPENRFGYYGRCLAYIKIKNYPFAIDDCSRAIKISSYYTHALANRGLAHFYQGNHNQAIEDFNQALKIYPEAFIFDNRGFTHLIMGDIEKAQSDFNSALDMNPNFSISEYHLGLTYAKQNQCFQAEQYFDKACQMGLQEACNETCSKAKTKILLKKF